MVRELLVDLAGLERTVGFRAPSAGLALVAGMGSEAWDRLFAGPRPAELHPFAEIHGDRHHAVSTPVDLLFHIRAAQHDVCFELASLIMDRLTGSARVGHRRAGPAFRARAARAIGCRAVTDRDPDAIWRPGYAGAVVWHRPRPRRRSAKVLVIAAGVAVAATGALAVSRITRGETARSPARGPIPTGADERWTVTLDASSVAAVTGDEDTIVAATGPQPELVAFDAYSGAERWRATSPAESLVSLKVVHGVVVADYLGSGGDQSLVGFDLDDGHQLWRTSVANGRGSLAGDGLVVPRFDPGRPLVSVDLLDAATGARVASIDADEISMSSTSVNRRAGDVIEWYDTDTFERRGRLDLAALDLEPFETDIAPTEAGLVVATAGQARLIDASGSVVSSVRLPSEVDSTTTLDELDGSGRFVVLQGATDTTMLSVHEGGLEVLWTRSARAVDWLIEDSHQLVAILPWGDQPGAYDFGAPWMEVIDATSGNPIWAGRLSRAVEGAFDVLGRNGFVAAGALLGGGAQSVAGYSFDGTELWRHPLGAGGRPLTLVPGGLVSVRTTASGAAILTLLS